LQNEDKSQVLTLTELIIKKLEGLDHEIDEDKYAEVHCLRCRKMAKQTKTT
jgi:hypothetical protein